MGAQNEETNEYLKPVVKEANKLDLVNFNFLLQIWPDKDQRIAGSTEYIKPRYDKVNLKTTVDQEGETVPLFSLEITNDTKLGAIADEVYRCLALHPVYKTWVRQD